MLGAEPPPAMLAAGLVVVAFLTAILSGVLGMAGGMVLMALLAAVLPVSAAMILHGVTQAASNGSRALVLRRHVRLDLFARHAAGSLLAFGLVRLVALSPDRSTLLITLGLVPFVARLLPRGAALDITRRGHALGCGFITTAIHLVAGVSGPLLDAWFQDAPLGRREVVATKAATQLFGHALKITHFGLLARAADTSSILTQAVAPLLLAGCAAAAIAGTWVGARLLERLPEATFRVVTRRVVLVLGVICLVQGAIAWRSERRAGAPRQSRDPAGGSRWAVDPISARGGRPLERA